MTPYLIAPERVKLALPSQYGGVVAPSRYGRGSRYANFHYPVVGRDVTRAQLTALVRAEC